jgi:hypothetical protein
MRIQFTYVPLKFRTHFLGAARVSHSLHDISSAANPILPDSSVETARRARSDLVSGGRHAASPKAVVRFRRPPFAHQLRREGVPAGGRDETRHLVGTDKACYGTDVAKVGRFRSGPLGGDWLCGSASPLRCCSACALGPSQAEMAGPPRVRGRSRDRRRGESVAVGFEESTNVAKNGTISSSVNSRRGPERERESELQIGTTRPPYQ